ncbi:MAG: hypothetical protein K2Y32_14150 [Candidatus Obscuribacterales bacterium]|nr:hypothetical protein [Candidatus Obscuribacterales bacterium]
MNHNQQWQLLLSTIEAFFKSANLYVTQAFELMPQAHEVGLDFVLLARMQGILGCHICSPGGFSFVINAEFIGGRRHYNGREIGDILISVRFSDRNGFRLGKLAFLQSKKLKCTPRNNQQFDFELGSKYAELNLNKRDRNGQDTQYELINRFENSSTIKVFYLLYNPGKVRMSVVIPGWQPGPVSNGGVRIVAASDLRAMHGNQPPATFQRIMMVQNLQLEEFMIELISCKHGTPINEEFDKQLELNLEEHSPIWSLNLDIHVPERFEIPTNQPEPSS